MATAREYNMMFKLQAQLGREFNSSFNQAQQTLQQTRAKIQELNKQQAGITAYQKQQTAIENTSRKLKDLQKEHDNIQREMKESASYSSALENKLIEKQRAIDNTTNALQRQTDKLNQQKIALQESGIDTSKLGDESKRLSGEIETLTNRESNLIQQSERFQFQGVNAFEAVGSALVASGIAAGLKAIYEAYGDCVKIAGDFQETMSAVEALSGANAEDMAALSEQAKELGATTKYTATQAAQAMTFMGMAGWDAQQMISGMDGVLSLAAASGEDLALTSDIVTDNLTAFGLKAEDTAHFADVLAAAATNSNTSVSVMGETFKQSASIAGALGYSIEDVSTAVGLMANAGVKGSIAGTALKNTFNGLLEGATLSGEAIGEVNINAVRADGTMKSFGETVNELRIYFSQMTEAERVNNAIAIAGQRGYNGLLAIVNSTEEDFNKLTDSINNCNGAAAKMAEIRMDNLNGQVTLMNSAMDALKTTVGEAYQEEFKALAKVATDILTSTNDFLSKNPVLLKALIAIAGAITGIVGAYFIFNTVKKAHNTLKQLSTVLSAKEAAARNLETLQINNSTAATTANAAASKAAMLQKGALIAVIAAVAAEFIYYANAIWGVSDSVKSVQEETQGIIDGMNDNIANSQAEMNILAEKVEVYDELRLKQNRTADEQAKLASLADELQEIFGENVQVVNSLTGEYNDLSNALDDFVEKQSQEVRLSNFEDAAKKAYAEIDKIEREKKKRTEEYHEYMNNFSAGRLLDWNGAVGQQNWMNDMAGYREAIAKNQKIIDEYEEELRKANGAQEDSEKKTNKSKASADALYKAVISVSGGYLSAADAASLYGITVEDINKATTSSKNYQIALKKAVDDVSSGFKTAEEAASQYGVTVNAVDTYSKIEADIQQIQTLAEKYNEALEAATKSVEGQYKLWDDAAEIVAQDIGAINASLQSQSDYWNTYNDNIAALTEKASEIEGLREVIATFADGSPESANMIAGLANATDDELKKMVQNWQAVQTEQKATEEGIAELVTGYGNINKIKEKLGEAVDALCVEDEAKAAAKNSIDAYIQAIEDGTDGAVAAAERLSSLVAAALNPSFKVNELSEQASFVGPRQIGVTGAYAGGTDSANAGLALVGEQGPELVAFRGGEKVITADETQQISRAYAEFISFVPLMMNLMETYSANAVMVNSADVVSRAEGQNVTITISPTFNVTGGNDIEEKLRSFSEEIVSEVMDAIEEAEIDARRRVYK